jgi:uncharacterized membrane protein
VLLLQVYYHGGLMQVGAAQSAVALVLTLGAFGVYDPLMKAVLKNPKQQFWVGFALSAAVVLVLAYGCGLNYRAYAIHLGGMYGTIMAANVWMRIWPAQQKIIRAVKDGQAPDPALVALAGGRSKHNTYMSIPLVFTMISQHTVVWAANSPLYLIAVIAVGFASVNWLYQKSTQVKGF